MIIIYNSYYSCCKIILKWNIDTRDKLSNDRWVNIQEVLLYQIATDILGAK